MLVPWRMHVFLNKPESFSDRASTLVRFLLQVRFLNPTGDARCDGSHHAFLEPKGVLEKGFVFFHTFLLPEKDHSKKIVNVHVTHVYLFISTDHFWISTL